jgi:hypothetical protein
MGEEGLSSPLTSSIEAGIGVSRLGLARCRADSCRNMALTCCRISSPVVPGSSVMVAPQANNPTS